VCPALAPGGEATLEGLGAWRGAVTILADGGSASATEDFIVRLRESGVARVIGERTTGAGCGYVDGAPPVTLPYLGLAVRAPNCARVTAEGVNEIEGLAPDVELPLDRLSGREAVAAVLAAVSAPR
jgi:C-terminal processing protease CtpA/Prc